MLTTDVNMESTFKIVLDRVHPKKNGTVPLRLRVYQNRKYREQSLSISISECDWDEQLQEVKPTYLPQSQMEMINNIG